MRNLSTFFVIAMTLTACTHQDSNQSDQYLGRKAVGVDSKTGTDLIAKELCSGLKVDGVTGENTVETLRFNANSTFFRRTLLIDRQVQFVVKKQNRGSWGLVNETLVLNENGAQSNLAIKEVANGLKTCYQIGSGEALSTFCACE